MIYFCVRKQEVISPDKAKRYCKNKQQCDKFRIYSNIGALNRRSKFKDYEQPTQSFNRRALSRSKEILRKFAIRHSGSLNLPE